MPLVPADRLQSFVRIVKKAFSERRKMARKLLKQEWPVEGLDAAFEEIGLSAQIRAERISVEQFAELTMKLTAVGGIL